MNNKAKREYFSCRCEKTKEDFLIRLELNGGKWYMVKGYKLPKGQGSADAGGGASGFNISDGLLTAETYACPCCGATSFCVCSCSKKATCYNGGTHNTCAYCQRTGEVSGGLESINLSGRDGG